MKTNNGFGRFIKTMDEAIPEATTENFKAKGKDIAKDVANTAVCATATCMCLVQTANDVGMVGLMASKGMVKEMSKTISGFYKSYYMDKPAMTVCR